MARDMGLDMNLIPTITVPIYDDSGSYPAFDHAVRLAERFASGLLVGAIVEEHQFIHFCDGGPGIIGAHPDERGLKEFKARMRAIGNRLVDSAKQRGLHARFLLIQGRLPDAFDALTRQCDLLVDSQLRLRSLLERVFGDPDIYSDACCPVLIPRGKRLALGPVLLVYDRTRRANRALRWLTQFAVDVQKAGLHVLAIFRTKGEREWLLHEISALTEAHSVATRIDAVAKKHGSKKALALAKELRAEIVAMPPHIMRRIKALRDIQSSLLLL